MSETVPDRPAPPEWLLEAWRDAFAPDPDLWLWVSETLLSEQGALYNPDHEHLQSAHIGFLWTNAECNRKGKRIAGMAEIPQFMCHAWQRTRQEAQIIEWFGTIPDFLITLDAHYAAECSDVDFCALIEHELYHCAQKLDEYGMPKFSKDTGLPSYTVRGHDVEEFVGVVQRYGAGSPESPMSQIVKAATAGPEVSTASISAACGNCNKAG